MSGARPSAHRRPRGTGLTSLGRGTGHTSGKPTRRRIKRELVADICRNMVHAVVAKETCRAAGSIAVSGMNATDMPRRTLRMVLADIMGESWMFLLTCIRVTIAWTQLRYASRQHSVSWQPRANAHLRRCKVERGTDQRQRQPRVARRQVRKPQQSAGRPAVEISGVVVDSSERPH